MIRQFSKLGLLFMFLLAFSNLHGKPLILSKKSIKNPPPRIIRTCCSFGTDLHVLSINQIKISDVTSIEKIGSHSYLGNPKEGNGIIYTQLGGFIDLGHLRDQADWTAYLYSAILANQSKGSLTLNLGIEGGKKKLTVAIQSDLDSNDAIKLAGKIAYDLSVWHEIATFFGASYVPFVPERYSSFSIEDIYSNLLGVNLGMKALSSHLPYEEAMTQLIKAEISELKAVETEAETYDAMEATRNIWWTREKSLPSRHILIKHQCKAYPEATPWLIPSQHADSIVPKTLTLITQTKDSKPLNGMYIFSIKLNVKLWEKKILKDYGKKELTQNDFETLLKEIESYLMSENY